MDKYILGKVDVGWTRFMGGSSIEKSYWARVLPISTLNFFASWWISFCWRLIIRIAWASAWSWVGRSHHIRWEKEPASMRTQQHMMTRRVLNIQLQRKCSSDSFWMAFRPKGRVRSCSRTCGHPHSLTTIRKHEMQPHFIRNKAHDDTLDENLFAATKTQNSPFSSTTRTAAELRWRKIKRKRKGRQCTHESRVGDLWFSSPNDASWKPTTNPLDKI